jgi:deoxyribonuclease-4
MLNIGCHLSSSKGYLHMGKEAVSLGGNTFQYFTRNPRGGQAKSLDVADAAAFLEFAKENAFAPILAHAPYTLNPASANPRVRDFARLVFLDDLERLEVVPGGYYNFHPGSHVGQGTDEGIRLICALLDEAAEAGPNTTILLETMSGKGSEIGGRFEELRAIMDGSAAGPRLGVCLDTCHVYDAGYDILNDLDGVLAEFDKVIGLDRLKAIHLNDSKNPYHSRKDRHEKIGRGHLGLAFFERVINHPALRELPFYLETPNELEGYAEEIALLKGLYR